MLSLRATAAVTLAVTTPVVCSAPRDARADARAAAKAHYEKGSVLYDLQRYEEAAVEYEAAYEAKPDPALLFNMGQAFRLAGKRDRALRAYQTFLMRVPRAPQRADIEARIEELKAQDRAEQEKAARDKVEREKADQARGAELRAAQDQAAAAAQQDATTSARAQSEHDARRARTLKWAGLGAGLGGVLLVVTGGGLYGAGNAAFTQLDSPNAGDVFDPATERRMNNLRPAGIALFSIGLAATAAGFATFGIGYKRERAARRATQAWYGHGALDFSQVGALP